MCVIVAPYVAACTRGQPSVGHNSLANWYVSSMAVVVIGWRLLFGLIRASPPTPNWTYHWDTKVLYKIILHTWTEPCPEEVSPYGCDRGFWPIFLKFTFFMTQWGNCPGGKTSNKKNEKTKQNSVYGAPLKTLAKSKMGIHLAWLMFIKRKQLKEAKVGCRCF